jgi:signal peptidase I
MQDISYYQGIRQVAQLMKREDAANSQTPKSDNQYQQQAWDYMHNPANPNPFNGQPIGEIGARPADKREHYVKRCVGIAGDKLEIKNGEIYINEQKQNMPEEAQHKYYVVTKGPVFGERMENKSGRVVLTNQALLDNLDIYVTEADLENTRTDTCIYLLNMPRHRTDEVRKIEGVISVERKIEPKGERDLTIFPHNSSYPWNNDNFGPMQIPAAGMKLKIDTGNICVYEKILSTYDNGIHHIEKKNGQVFYDGAPITEYTFKQDYYWMMGDNRHNSADSRSWGFVPFDHVVGKPVFVWFSMKYAENNPISGKSVVGSLIKNSKEGKFRWERFICYVGENGLVSVKIPFLIIVLSIWGYNTWNKRRQLKIKDAKN